MSDTTTEARIKVICSEHLGVDQEAVIPTAEFEKDLRADSLDVVELCMAFEEEFGIEIPDSDIEKMITVGNAIEYVDARLAAKA